MTPLQKAFKFTQDDLDANREGRASSRQRQRLKDYRWMAIVLAIAGLALLGFMAAFSAALEDLLIGALVIAIGLLVRAAYLWIQHLRRANMPVPLLSVSGPIALDATIESDWESYSGTIGQQVFDLQRRQYETLCNGDFYRFYYTTAPLMILSVEEL